MPHLLSSACVSDAVCLVGQGVMVELGVYGTSNLRVQKGRGNWIPWLCRGGGAGAVSSQESLDALAVKLHPSTAMLWCDE